MSSEFNPIELKVWTTFEEEKLKLSAKRRSPAAQDEGVDEEGDTGEELDVDGWVEEFCERNQQVANEGKVADEASGSVLSAADIISTAARAAMLADHKFVKSVCLLGLYAGKHDEFNQRSGAGKAIYANGDRYEGEFLDGKKHGNGTYVFACRGMGEIDRLVERSYRILLQQREAGAATETDEEFVDRMSSTYAIGAPAVKFMLELGFFPCYRGMYIRGRRTGYGCMRNDDGSVYIGDFIDGNREGQGVLHFINGDAYSGKWRHGQKHGYGTYRFAGGKGEFRGEWQQGKFIEGQWLLADGVYYEGKFSQNRPNDPASSIHFPKLKAVQTGDFSRNRWAPTSGLHFSDEAPLDGAAWTS